MDKLGTNEVQGHGFNNRARGIYEKLKAIAQFLFLGVIFGIAYTQDPIYNSPENQNTKYLHGLAQAGHGFLNEDWLAGTLDPLPAFTALVQFTYTFLHHEYAFYVYYILIFGLYVYSLKGIVSSVYPIEHHRTRTLLFLVFFFFIHLVHIEIGNFDTGWHLHSGVAQQYILGPVFQPANFGAFLLLSIHLYLKHHPFWAVGMLAIAVTMHPAYFPSIAVLAFTYVVLLWWNECRTLRRSILRPLGVGALAVLLALPVYLYMTLAFQDTAPELAQQATDIIVNQRIPHHSIPDVWLAKGRAYYQTAVVAIAIWLIRKHKLAFILFVPFGIAVTLTMLQMQIDNDTLAFIAPWRISVFLVPIGTSLILAHVATSLSRGLPQGRRAQSLTRGICVGIIAILVVAGTMDQVDKFRNQDITIPMLNAVREMRQSGDVYLVPPAVNKLRKFRLYTGAAIFINRKSHPYKDTEVIAWNDRLNLAREFYATEAPRPQCRLLKRTLVKEYGVTHVVMEAAQRKRPCQGFTEVYHDQNYSVYARAKS